jgi:hypothetical protein
MNLRRLVSFPQVQEQRMVPTIANTLKEGLAELQLGQKQTYAVQTGMSALPPKADMCSAVAYVRFGPKADTDASPVFWLNVLDPHRVAAISSRL